MVAGACSETLFVGPGERFSNYDMTLSIECSIPRVARAYQETGMVPQVLVLITGTDAAGSPLPGVVSNGRNSIAPKFCGLRTSINESFTLTQMEPWLSQSRRTVYTQMTASQTRLLLRLINASLGKTCLLLTRSQCEDREATFELAKSCELIQLDASDLEVWTGIWGDVAGGINYLRDRGISSVMVTDGKRGITAFLNEQWHHQPAFRVGQRSATKQCGDISFGTYLAARDLAQSIPEALKLAAAAASMHLANIERHEYGLDELLEFARVIPIEPYLPDARLTVLDVIKRATRAAKPLLRSTAYFDDN